MPDYFLPRFLYWQFFVTPPLPKEDFAGQTVIVTGGNNGLGLEAARHFTNKNAKKVVITARTPPKGEAAKESIEESSGRKGVVEVWPLDLNDYASVKAFVRQCQSLDRVDVLVENAGIQVKEWVVTEGNESTITVNVISTFLLALMMLPKLRETASKYNVTPHLVIVGSEVHFMNDGKKERAAPSILEYVRQEKNAEMGFPRYSLSKLFELLYVRQLARRINEGGNPQVILNLVNPGLCHTAMAAEATAIQKASLSIVARSAEIGARNYICAAAAGQESHGQFLSNGVVTQ